MKQINILMLLVLFKKEISSKIFKLFNTISILLKIKGDINNKYSNICHFSNISFYYICHKLDLSI